MFIVPSVHTPCARADNLEHIVEMAGEGAGGAAQHGIDIATTQQHRGDQRRVCAHSFAGERLRHAAAPHQAVVLAPGLLVAGIAFKADDLAIGARLQAANPGSGFARLMTSARPTSTGLARPSSTMTCAARNTRSSSPSAKATRFCAAFAAANTGSMLEPD